MHATTSLQAANMMKRNHGQDRAMEVKKQHVSCQHECGQQQEDHPTVRKAATTTITSRSARTMLFTYGPRVLSLPHTHRMCAPHLPMLCSVQTSACMVNQHMLIFTGWSAHNASCCVHSATALQQTQRTPCQAADHIFANGIAHKHTNSAQDMMRAMHLQATRAPANMHIKCRHALPDLIFCRAQFLSTFQTNKAQPTNHWTAEP
jgi:hypothetical protein